MGSTIPKYLNLKEDEQLVALVHPTFLAYTGSILGTLFFLSAAFFFIYPLFRMGAWGIAGFILLLVVAKYFAIRVAIGRYGNMYVITNERLIDVERKGIFDRIVSEVPLGNIHDVSFRMKGLLGMFLHIGTITVRTIGGATNFEWRWVRNPEDVREMLLEIQRGAAPSEALPGAELRDEQLKILLAHYLDDMTAESLKELHMKAEELLERQKSEEGG